MLIFPTSVSSRFQPKLPSVLSLPRFRVPTLPQSHNIFLGLTPHQHLLPSDTSPTTTRRLLLPSEIGGSSAGKKSLVGLLSPLAFSFYRSIPNVYSDFWLSIIWQHHSTSALRWQSIPLLHIWPRASILPWVLAILWAFGLRISCIARSIHGAVRPNPPPLSVLVRVMVLGITFIS